MVYILEWDSEIQSANIFIHIVISIGFCAVLLFLQFKIESNFISLLTGSAKIFLAFLGGLSCLKN